MTPQADVNGPLEAQLFVREAGGAVPVDVKPEQTADGAFRWRAPASRLSGDRLGAVDFLVVVARKGAMPDPRHIVDGPRSGTGWQAGGVRVLIRPIADE